MTLGTWADVGLMFIILETLVVVLIPLVLFALFARGMMLANQKIREIMPTVQMYAQQMADGTEQISERIAEPVIQARATTARWEGRWTRIKQSVRGDSPTDGAGESGTPPGSRPNPDL
jgi:hypothetical protein